MTSVLRVAKTLSTMTMQMVRTRARRSASRFLSPRRLIATLGAILFFALYVVNGILVILTRKPADPAELTLWLGGAMAVYGMFHFVRAAWQEPESRLGLSQAESLWIARAPISNIALVGYRFAGMVPSTVIKTLLIATILICDVQSPLRLVVALVISMLVLEALRMIADRWSASLSVDGRIALRTAMTAIAIAVLVQVVARTVAAASGSVHPLALVNAFSIASGETAAGEMIQWLSLPWWPMTQFAIASSWNFTTMGDGVLSVFVAMTAVVAVIVVDRWSSWHQEWVEGDRLIAIRRGTVASHSDSPRTARPRKSLWRLPKWTGIGPLLARQWIGVVRYRGTIFVSLAVPAALSLAPLMTSPEAGLLHVAAWLAVSTFLLAPPALRIDFRRDIDRMWLLKSLPITPLAMTMGQILLPSLITIAFQLVVVALACMMSSTSFAMIALVIGGLSGFALFSFAIENALFLTFPHRPKQEGLAMMVRAKLMFLGKGLLLAIFGGVFIAWVSMCSTLQWNLLVLVGGCITASWGIAAIAVTMTARCWRRFEMRLDSPLGH